MDAKIVKPASARIRRQTFPPKRILVAHDDADIRDINEAVLLWAGYQVYAAADGAAAWRALNSFNYDLLITDYDSPKMSGVDLLKKLHAVRRALPVILASRDIPKRQIAQNPWLQPAVTLIMPYTAEEFLETVKDVLGTSNNVRAWVAPPPSRPSRASSRRLEVSGCPQWSGLN